MSFAKRWAQGYERAWLAGDAEAAGALYAEDCTFRSQPFRELENAQQYARNAYQQASAREVWFGEPIEHGDRASVEWWALLVTPEGEDVTLAGCSVLRFGSDGKVIDSRDYWHEEPSHRRPPDGWGPLMSQSPRTGRSGSIRLMSRSRARPASCRLESRAANPRSAAL